MHPWHDIILAPEDIEKAFPVVIEIPRGSRARYEVVKPVGLPKLDRVHHGAGARQLSAAAVSRIGGQLLWPTRTGDPCFSDR